ncbi:hypothetical protein [Aureimonas sp. AU22]|uniref:hypothetical protein n=1 Tax=Aureimonas sp. AU22 TaxID=1638162 RepID=UPI00078055CF|nr:hypothetical protein [Aureimonas sp. AU22]
MKRQREMTEVRIERQVAKVARLSRELRFELLLLDRMRTRLTASAPRCDTAPVFSSLAEVYAMAIARRSETDSG